MDPNVVTFQPTVSTAPSAPQKTPSGKGKFIIFFLVILVFILIFLGLGSYAVAYDKVNINNSELQARVSNLVIGLPFMPKTPKYLLQAAAYAHEQVSKHTFDISLAMEGDTLSSMMGTNKVDFQIKGGIDYSDLKNIKFYSNILVTNDLNIDIKKKEKMIYFKINKIPPIIYPFLGVDENKIKPIFDNWIGWDTSSLDTEARRNLNYYVKEDQENNLITQTTDTLLSNKILSDMRLSDDSEDGFAVYKIHLDATSELLDLIESKMRETQEGGMKLRTESRKASDTLKDTKIDIWIDKKEFFVRKFTIYTKLKPDINIDPQGLLSLNPVKNEAILGINNLGQSEYTLSAAVKFGDFGSEIKVEEPDKFLKPEEAMNLMAQTLSIPSPADQIRKAHLQTIKLALENCFAEQKRYPRSLTDLTDGSCPASNPNISITDPQTSEQYEYFTNAARSTFTLKAKLSSGEAYTLTEGGS